MNAITARLQTYDRTLVISAALLLVAGFVLSLAASPSATARIGYDAAFHFSLRQGLFSLLGVALFGCAASLSPKGVRRLSTVIYALCLALMLLVLVVGAQTKGAQRWLNLGWFSLQPSEFLKPALVVLMAWMLSERMKIARFPGIGLALGFYGAAAVLLIAQPDVGQTALLAIVLATMLFSAGVSWMWLVGVAGGGAGVMTVLYFTESHVRARIDAFGGETPYQVEQALDAIRAGGALGRGPGEGLFKLHLPDGQGDFIYAVAAEEFGLLASAGLIWLYALVAWRGLTRAQRLADPFAQLAGAGLITLFVLQAAIHIAVNLAVMPAKGMTLPLVSYGGSSMLGSALTLGFALALMRWRQGAYIYEGGAR